MEITEEKEKDTVRSQRRKEARRARKSQRRKEARRARAKAKEAEAFQKA